MAIPSATPAPLTTARHDGIRRLWNLLDSTVGPIDLLFCAFDSHKLDNWFADRRVAFFATCSVRLDSRELDNLDDNRRTSRVRVRGPWERVGDVGQLL